MKDRLSTVSQDKKWELLEADSAWWEQWQLLREIICSAAKAIGAELEDAEKMSDCQRSVNGPVYQSLLLRLLAFGDNQFSYFYYGFNNGPNDGDEISCKGHLDKENIELREKQYAKLIVDLDYHPDYILRQIYDQVVRDFEAIRSAYYVRMHGSDLECRTLEAADKLGEQIVPLDSSVSIYNLGQTIETPGLVKRPMVVISHFDVSASTRILPYANVVLVSIPYSATSALSGRQELDTKKLRDLFVVAHELGHYVYRYGVTSNSDGEDERLSALLPAELFFIPPFIKNWTEEIFCDVFTVIALGDEDIVESVKKWIHDNPLQELYEDSGVHPVDAIRSDIYAKTANLIEKSKPESGSGSSEPTENKSDIAETADSQDVETIQGFVFVRDETGEQVKVEIQEEIIPVIDEVVKHIFEILWPYYRNQYILSEELTTPPALAAPAGLGIGMVVDMAVSIARILEYIALDGDKRPFEILRDYPFDQPLEPNIWQVVFHADGWIDGDLDARTTTSTRGWE